MCDMVTLGGKNNGLDPGNYISTLMSGSLDLWTSKNGGALHRKIAGMTNRKYFGLNCL